MSLAPFFRYEYLDTQHDVPSGFTGDDSQELEIYTVGLSFKPIPQVVLKVDYRSRDARAARGSRMRSISASASSSRRPAAPGRRCALRSLGGARRRRGSRGRDGLLHPARSARARVSGRRPDRRRSRVLIGDAQAARIEAARAEPPRIAARAHLHRLPRRRGARLRVHRRAHRAHAARGLHGRALARRRRCADPRMLAFHEPLEYMPAARWFEQFERRRSRTPLRLGGDVHGIVGATLSTRAATEACAARSRSIRCWCHPAAK